jgi:hypothetical protein
MEKGRQTAGQEGATRRSFLVDGVRFSVAGIGFGHRWLFDTAQIILASGIPRAAVPIEPPAPSSSSSYVTRPDLTPPGVSVQSSAALSATGLSPHYLFCAPKSPLAANPGGLAYRTHPFPSGTTPLMILDTSGELVWFRPLPGEDEIPFNFRLQNYRGRPTLTWFQGSVQGRPRNRWSLRLG